MGCTLGNIRHLPRKQAFSKSPYPHYRCFLGWRTRRTTPPPWNKRLLPLSFGRVCAGDKVGQILRRWCWSLAISHTMGGNDRKRIFGLRRTSFLSDSPRVGYKFIAHRQLSLISRGGGWCCAHKTLWGTTVSFSCRPKDTINVDLWAGSWGHFVWVY